MHWFPRALFFCIVTCCSVQSLVAQQNPASANSSSVDVSAGVPLRVVLDNRTPSTKVGQPLRGHLAQPIYVFDRVAIPAGTEVLGRVAEVNPVSKRKRANAIIKGDFTPLKEAQVQFSALVLKDGTQLPIQSTGAERDSAVVQMSSSSGEKGLWNRMKGTVTGAVSNEKRTLDGMIHKPNKKEELKNALLARLPYHPQVFETGTQFVAELQAPIRVQSPEKGSKNMALLGTRPPANSVVHARLNSEISSATNKWGDRVEATLTQPLLSGDQNLILPEGTRLVGSVTHAVPGKKFGRNGQLSFTFREIQLPLGSTQPIKGQLSGVESGQALKVDEEGNTRAAEPKMKYLAPLAIVLLARGLSENDGDGINGGQSGSVNNAVAGGAFGWTGRLISFAAGSRPLAYSLGYFGASQAIYSRFIARGRDVVFPRDTQLEINIGNR